MRKFFIFLVFNFVLGVVNPIFIGSASAQNPLVKQWDHRFGAVDAEELSCIIQTADNGYLLGGNSNSGIGGDKSEAAWGFGGDYWIIKLNAVGAKMWDKRFGGMALDEMTSVLQTRDGGYLLGGSSISGIGGDKTQPVWGGASDYDYWIVKTDSAGNKMWDKDFGGIHYDKLSTLLQADDGGYLLCGSSRSSISGDKTQQNRDTSGNSEDYWVIKIDSLGNKLWDKDFGGTSLDFLFAAVTIDDGGYVLAGQSSSGANGDKSEAGWGSADYWLVRIDSLGNKIADKDFGGTSGESLPVLTKTSDGGYLIAGISLSGSGGDKTEANQDTFPTYGAFDFWMVRMDSAFNKVWDKKLGGYNSDDIVGNVSETSDGGYLIAGTSYSDISGDKSENNLGREQTWVIKINSSGTKRWDKTLHTDIGFYDDEVGYAMQTPEGCYVMANYTYGDIGGDKSEATRGYFDYWIIKFCDTSAAILPTAIGSVISSSPICTGTCINFSNQSMNATSWQWFFPGATPDSSRQSNPQNVCYPNPGSYDVQLIASNANGSDTLLLSNYITVYPSPPPQSITQSGDTLFSNASATSYQWYFNGNIINGATDYFYIAPSSGDYNVVCTDGNGCEVEAAVFNVVASAPLLVNGQWSLYPNPAGNEVKIQKSEVKSLTAIRITIYNMVGEKVMTQLQDVRTKNQEVTVNVSAFSNGIYFIEITCVEQVFRSKFVKSGNR